MVKAYVVNAFSENKNEGNSAGVILNADNLTEKQMTSISSQLGFSESAFVQKSDKADYRVRFFSPKQEVDLCGHATIAAFHLLIEKGLIQFGNLEKKVVTQETNSGILQVTCYMNGLVVMEQNQPQYFETQNDYKDVAELLGLEENDLLKEHPLQIVSTGKPKLIIPVVSLEKLFSIKSDFDGIIEYCEKTGAKGFYPFTFDTKSKTSDFHTRQFNPIAGIYEDPLTGVAAGALGSYIIHNGISKKNNFVIEQGYIINKPGKISVDIGEKVLVGGKAITIDEKELELT